MTHEQSKKTGQLVKFKFYAAQPSHSSKKYIAWLGKAHIDFLILLPVLCNIV